MLCGNAASLFKTAIESASLNSIFNGALITSSYELAFIPYDVFNIDSGTGGNLKYL